MFGDADHMPKTHGPTIIERSSEAAHIWFRDVAEGLSTDDMHDAARALRAVLHALRDRLTVEEAAQLSAQLPTLIRGIYFEGWRPGAARRHVHDIDTFLDLVAAEGLMSGRTEASIAVAAVAHVLDEHVSEGELDDVRANLPARLRPLFVP